MLSFLAPAALAGLALLSIPILIHLFKPRKVRQTPFPSLRFLHLTQQKLARRIRWHQVLLFLLRAGFIGCIVLALARPMLAPRGTEAFLDRFIVLDVSRSMAYQAAGRPTPIDLGREVALKLVRDGLAGDRTAVLLAGATTRSLGPLTRDADTFLPLLQGVQATASETDLTSALKVIRPMLAHRPAGTRARIFFITDNHQLGWRQGAIASFVRQVGDGVDAEVIDVGVAAPQNAWIVGARLVEISPAAGGAPPRRAVRVQVGAVGEAAAERTVRLTGLPGQPERTAAVSVEPGTVGQVDIEIPADADLTDTIATIAIDPADALPSDDELFLNLGANLATRVLLIEGEGTQIEPLRPGFHLRMALEALASQAPGMIRVEARTVGTVGPEDAADADVIVLADVPELGDAVVTAIESRVRAGAGALIFLGPDLRPAFADTRLCKPLAASDSLLPAAPRGVLEFEAAPGGGDRPLADVEWSHPLLAPLFDPVLGDLQRTRFRACHRFDSVAGAAPLGGARTLARIGDRAPAILEHDLGAGKVLVFNTSPDDTWSDLPRRRSFVPLIDRALAYLSGGTVRRTFEVGDAVALPVAGAAPGEQVTVTMPGGRTLTRTLDAAGSRAILRLDAVPELGAYRVVPQPGSATRAFAFVVQAGRGDSVMTQADPATLKQWWSPLVIDIVSPDSVLSGGPHGDRRVALWPWLVAAASLLLMAETFLVHRLCPRMNPAVTAQQRRSSLVARETRGRQSAEAVRTAPVPR